ncbi:hypothetical protein [Rhodoplanes sp. SY1]|uniref:hypothetical protein n=1 Tax=Rhodoplanes sp. SY1 TaxID=3166646 RepID=UPI0038B49FB9
MTSTIATAVEQQDIASREISQSAQMAAHGNACLVGNISGVTGAIDETSRSAAGVLDKIGGLTRDTESLAGSIQDFFERLGQEQLSGQPSSGGQSRAA